MTFELRDAGDGTYTFEGLASRVEVPYEVGFYTEVIRRGAFKRSVNNPALDVQLLVNHEGLPLARTTSDDLHLSEVPDGLHVVAQLDASDPEIQTLAKRIKRGTIDEMSMAFRAVDQAWDSDYTKREILSADLHRGDVSVVSYGASPTTSATIRSQLSLEQRRQRAERIGNRANGPERWPEEAPVRRIVMVNHTIRARAQLAMLQGRIAASERERRERARRRVERERLERRTGRR
jgi:HK97 family phage prohead protease